ncbi:MAG: TMEM175 family protein [Anaerolineales bacterium]
MAESHLPEDKFGLDRVVFFSDAVIAIAITLLVLELKVPEIEPNLVGAELTQRVLALWPNYLGFFTSFWVIGMYWVTHHRMFRYIQGYDQGLLLINLWVLFFIALMPFPTALLFRYPAQWISVLAYAGTILAIGLTKAALWRYATHRHRLVAPTLPPRLIRSMSISILATPAVFLLSIILAFFNAEWAMYSWLLVLPLYFYYRPARQAAGA